MKATQQAHERATKAANTAYGPTKKASSGPSAKEKAWRMWGTKTCEDMQKGWKVCTNTKDNNHKTVMANCPWTCAKYGMKPKKTSHTRRRRAPATKKTSHKKTSHKKTSHKKTSHKKSHKKASSSSGVDMSGGKKGVFFKAQLIPGPLMKNIAEPLVNTIKSKAQDLQKVMEDVHKSFKDAASKVGIKVEETAEVCDASRPTRGEGWRTYI